jgi:hypothetical protein
MIITRRRLRATSSPATLFVLMLTLDSGVLPSGAEAQSASPFAVADHTTVRDAAV